MPVLSRLLLLVLLSPILGCSSELGLNSSLQIQLASTDPTLFDDINSLLFLAYPVSSTENCQSLEDTTYGQVMLETQSELPFVAVPKLHTDNDNIENHPEGVDGPYFRHVFGDLPSGELHLLTLGSTEIMSPEEASQGHITSEAGEEGTFLQRFPYDSMIARSCLTVQIVEGERTEAVLLLFPHSYEEAPRLPEDAGL